jgi:secondary thiamine-phosphate synthase enzyme
MELQINTKQRNQIIDITRDVEKIIDKNFNKDSKACLIYTVHTTCGIMIEENYDPDVNSDILMFLEKIAPKEGWKHSEGNSDSHIKSMIVGVSKLVPVKDKKLLLGKWQGISLCEFDGPRTRKIIIIEI